MKAKTSLPLHHDCNLGLDIMHTLLRFIVKKLSQYLGGCWNIHCASADVVYFKLDVLVFFYFYFFLFQTIRANPINLAKRRHVFFMVQMLLQFMHSLRFYPQQLWNPVKLDSCGKREHLNFFIFFVYGQFHHHGRYIQTQFYTFKLLLIFTYLQYMCLQTLVGWTGNFVSQFDLFDKEKINIKRYVTDVT